uniref:Conserved secreted protein n=1 Tax=Haemonchus contortus TaxID=6289 RepID=A0A7I4YS19_HAECO
FMSPLSLLCALLVVYTALADVNDEAEQHDRDLLQLNDDGISSVKRARNPYSWMVVDQSKRSRNPYSWMVHSKGKRSLRYFDDAYRQPRNPYSWLYTMFDKRARNPYSWMNE